MQPEHVLKRLTFDFFYPTAWVGCACEGGGEYMGIILATIFAAFVIHFNLIRNMTMF